MLMALDIGNSDICGGLFDEKENLHVQFRKSSKHSFTSDELGIFLRSVLRENQIDPAEISGISMCSVVPSFIHSFKNCCAKYFQITPFILSSHSKTGIQIQYKNPLELGSDRIANAIAASHLFKNEDVIIIDFGTATTFCVLTKDKDYLGGAIIPGLRTAMESLEAKTARLPNVEIVIPEPVIGKTTVENIQSGLYFGTMGMVRELTQLMKKEGFGPKSSPRVIATGGFASLFAEAGIFDIEIPDLTLRGLLYAYRCSM
ncbi:MAG: type III pantothenate kinase [Oligoflexales bacterium]|nr:type III pantothenate kinase [Oligoflexales bacterium]